MGKVLVADDSAVVRAAVARRLRDARVEVVEVASAEAAASVAPDGLACALLDLDLGDGSGVDVAAALRAAAKYLPIAFFSSETAPDVLARAAEFGRVYAKPSELDAAIGWALSKIV